MTIQIGYIHKANLIKKIRLFLRSAKKYAQFFELTISSLPLNANAYKVQDVKN